MNSEMNDKNLCTIYLVRHGQTDWNVEGIMQGHSDPPLNEQGRKEARKVAQVLKEITFDAVYSSDLARAKQTAEVIALEKELAVLTRKRLRERNFGRFEGKRYEEVARDYDPIRQKLMELGDETAYKAKPFHDIESDEEMVTRFITVLREIAVAHPSQTVLVTSHGGVMRQFLIRIGWGNYQTLPPGTIKNTGSVVITSDGVDFFVKETKGIKKQDLTEKST